MTPTAPPAKRPKGRPRLLVPVLTILVLLVLGIGGIVSFYVDWLWFGEVGYREVLTRSLTTRVVLFAIGVAATLLVVAVNAVVAYRTRPDYQPLSPEQQSLERYRIQLAPRKRSVVVVAGVTIGIFVGTAVAAGWRTVLLWRNAVPFDREEPLFGRDASFFVFTLPFYRFVLSLLITLLLLSLVTAAVVHYVYGGLRLQGAGERVTRAAGVHFSMLFGLFLLVKAVGYYLDRFALVLSQGQILTGAGYTDVNARLPALNIMMWIALLAAIVCFANVVLRISALPVLATVLVLGTSLVVAGIYPALVEQFRVRPNANELESPFIERNIEATRVAYGVDKVQYQPYEGSTAAGVTDLTADARTIHDARLMDPNVLSPTFTQLQQIRNVYGFPPSLDIDRYRAEDGQMDEQVVAVRELDTSQLTGQQLNWINRHLVYTHGNGFVGAPTNVPDAQGAPTFTTGDLPTTGQIVPEQPRIYYGELTTDYSVVGSSGDSAPREFDRPASDGGTGQVTYTYTGKGGIELSNPVRRLAFAAYYREGNLLLSSAITRESKILIERNPAERVAKVAPFLELDSDPYPSVVNGRVVWMIDGYTTTNAFPYAQLVNFQLAATDSLNTPNVQGLVTDQVNYVRNSVKATVDAYDGTVTLYQFDPADPILAAWKKIFPDLIKGPEAITDDLRAHMRYPEDLFKIQREILTRYHVDDPVQFFGGQGFWRVPPDPTVETGEPQPPYYILAQAPGQDQPTFQITAALTQQRRDNLAAWMSASSDPDDYGTIRVLELPGNTAIRGPRQVQIAFNTDPNISRDVTLLNQQKSKVVFGNLLTLPVAGGLLYVEPLYVEGTGETSYPLLRKVMLEFGGQVAYENTLTEALDSLFGPGAGALVAAAGSGQVVPPPVTPEPPPDQATDLTQAAQDIERAIADLQAAQQSGDFAAYGKALAELDAATKRYLELAQQQEQTPAPTVTPARSLPSGRLDVGVTALAAGGT